MTRSVTFDMRAPAEPAPANEATIASHDASHRSTRVAALSTTELVSGASSLGSIPSLQSELSSILDIIRWEDLTLAQSGQFEEGGFGQVFFGHWHQTPVAIKKLNAASLRSSAKDEARSNFAHEMRMLAETRHPNCLQILCACLDEENMAVVSEMMQGGDLAKLLFAPDVTLSDTTRLHILIKVAMAMEYLHEKGVIHRDLKPHNILLGKDLTEVKVADFGLASSLVDSSVMRGGTQNYAAPEVLAGHEATREIGRAHV